MKRTISYEELFLVMNFIDELREIIEECDEVYGLDEAYFHLCDFAYGRDPRDEEDEAAPKVGTDDHENDGKCPVQEIWETAREHGNEEDGWACEICGCHTLYPEEDNCIPA